MGSDDDVPRIHARPWGTIALLGAAVAFVAVIGLVLRARGSGAEPEVRERATYARPMPAPSADAYRTGGVPLHDAAVEASLVELADASVRRSPPTLRRAPFTGGLAEAWQRLVRAWEGWLGRDAFDVRAELAELAGAGAGSDLDDEAPAIDDLALNDVAAVGSAEKELRAAVRAFDEALVTAGLGYFLEARVRGKKGDAQAFLRAFRVEEVTILDAGGRTYSIPSLFQIDHVSVRHAAMGLESPDLGAIVIVTPIRRYALTDVLPVLAADGAFNLGMKTWQASPPGARLCKLVGEAVRREVTAALGRDAAVAGTVGDRIVRRREIVDRWRVILKKSDGVFLPVDDLTRIAEKVPKAEYAEVIALEDELERLEAPRILSLVEQLVATSVRRHELAHLIDRARPTPLPVPKLLADLVGDGGKKLVHARAEIAGYLSQLIDDPVTPHLTLWGLATAAFELGTSAESRAGAVIVKGLAAEAGVDIDRAGDEQQLAYLARIAEPLARLDGPTLRRHAAALWTNIYGEDHLPITDQRR